MRYLDVCNEGITVKLTFMRNYHMFVMKVILINPK